MRPFWTLVGIRAAFWIGTALTLLWVPLHGSAIPADGAYSSLTDVLFATFEHWDAQWFLHVAKDGYNETSAAFFPLYPVLLHALHWIFRSWLVAGALLSLAPPGVAAWALAQIARPLLGDAGARRTCCRFSSCRRRSCSTRSTSSTPWATGWRGGTRRGRANGTARRGRS